MGFVQNVKRMRSGAVMEALVDHPEWMPMVFDEEDRRGEPAPPEPTEGNRRQKPAADAQVGQKRSADGADDTKQEKKRQRRGGRVAKALRARDAKREAEAWEAEKATAQGESPTSAAAGADKSAGSKKAETPGPRVEKTPRVVTSDSSRGSAKPPQAKGEVIDWEAVSREFGEL